MTSPSKYRRASSRRLEPPPELFAQNFIEGGWRRIERKYGARNDLTRKWMALSGGERHLKLLRQEYLAKQRLLAKIPEGFAERFQSDGWKGVDRHFGAPTETMAGWLKLLGLLPPVASPSPDVVG